jgi:amidase
LKPEFLDRQRKDVSGVFEVCGILSDEELDITSRDATDIVNAVRNMYWSAEKVCLAFCKRAAIAQQLVSRYPLDCAQFIHTTQR